MCSSNHFILDRIAEKESTDNLHRSGSEHEEVEDADIRQVGDLDDDDDDDETRTRMMLTRTRMMITRMMKMKMTLH